MTKLFKVEYKTFLVFIKNNIEFVLNIMRDFSLNLKLNLI